MRDTKTIIEDIKDLVKSKGYIYALCMILFDDFHIDPEKLHIIDYRASLSINEASLLLGFLIQNEINLTVPDSPGELIEMKKQTYALMEELHNSFNLPFIDKLKQSIENPQNKENYRTAQKEFFGKGNLLIESIFYSGTGVYDFQYFEFLEKKYKYDMKWLVENKSFEISETKRIVLQIKDILQKKSEIVNWRNLKQTMPEFIERLKKKKPNEDWDKHAQDILPMIEFHQYLKLFFQSLKDEQDLNSEKIKAIHWQSFYENLIDLFVIKKENFNGDVNINSFLDKFSINPKIDLNENFKTVGDYNLINSHPIIRLDSERFFVPITFLLFESVYESPFYWMISDTSYKDEAAKNRGRTGEEITYDFLIKVFGEHRTFQSVKITSRKGHDDTDIDVLCILGSKALCVQVKSKKLTEISRKGNDEALKRDFQGAVQDAYEQGLIARQRILEKGAQFINKEGQEIKLSEEINEVYIMGITTENYPSLTHQCNIMLDKKDGDPYPIVLSIFDLEIVVHYLNDPYEFLYYIRQRINLMDYFISDQEISFLSYHLQKKLWKTPNLDGALLEQSFAQTIDRNYYPLKLGLEISDKGDKLKNRWINEDFNKLCNEIKTIKDARITDIIFHLLDESGKARDNLIYFIKNTKLKTLKDGKSHNFSLPPDDNSMQRVGITYMSLNTNDRLELKYKLLSLCKMRKYRSKADVWIGFGSIKNNSNMIDAIVFSEQKWIYNEDLEKDLKKYLETEKQGRFMRLGEKVGRNDKCPCGSGLKYKKCCGNN